MGTIGDFCPTPSSLLLAVQFLPVSCSFSKKLSDNWLAPILGNSGSATANTFCCHAQCCGFSPPANKVWDKVIFSEVSVSIILLTGGLCMMSLPALLPDPMFLLERRVSVQGGSLQWSLPESEKSGQCASYWNAFLLGIAFHCCKLDHRISDKFS